MGLPTYWLAIAVGLAMLGSLALALLASRLPPFPGRRSFVAMLLAAAWWDGAVALEHATEIVAQKIFCAEMAYLGIFSVVGLWAAFIWNYIYGRTHPAPRAAYVVVFGIALTAWLLALTNAQHHLIYTGTDAVGAPPAMTVRYTHGPVFVALAVLFHSLFVIGEGLILYQVTRVSALYRTHYLGLAFSTLLPWIANVGYQTKTITYGAADLTPLSFALMNAILYWLIKRRHLFELVPIARGILLDAIPDPVLVLDANRRIVECNPAARAVAGGRPLAGLSLESVPELQACLTAVMALSGSGDAVATRELVLGAPPRTFDLGDTILNYEGRLVGHLILLRDITHRKEAERRLHRAMAELETQLQANLALQEKLREEAIRDPLTGLHNRRFFDELAPGLLADAARAGVPLAAAMVDVDHFKRLNDTHGHAAGDAVLRHVGEFIRRHVRQSDVVFRMGGEEFLILLPRTRRDQALRRLETCRAAFAAGSIDHAGTALSASFSAGLAVFPDHAQSVSELLAAADGALYRAKADGRNRTAVA